jgi:hypothetical protein
MQVRAEKSDLPFYCRVRVDVRRHPHTALRETAHDQNTPSRDVEIVQASVRAFFLAPANDLPFERPVERSARPWFAGRRPIRSHRWLGSVLPCGDRRESLDESDYLLKGVTPLL